MSADPKSPRSKSDEPATDPAVLSYIGAGGYLQGVPARDLTAADLARLDDETKNALEASGLYQKAGR